MRHFFCLFSAVLAVGFAASSSALTLQQDNDLFSVYENRHEYSTNGTYTSPYPKYRGAQIEFRTVDNWETANIIYYSNERDILVYVPSYKEIINVNFVIYPQPEPNLYFRLPKIDGPAINVYSRSLYNDSVRGAFRLRSEEYGSGAVWDVLSSNFLISQAFFGNEVVQMAQIALKDKSQDEYIIQLWDLGIGPPISTVPLPASIVFYLSAMVVAFYASARRRRTACTI